MRALLALEDGTVFEGEGFGATGRTIGEMVFHTGMAACQDVLTNPTNYGQIVTLTYPLAGNSGIDITEPASCWPTLSGLVAREICVAATLRGALSLDQYMKNEHIIGLHGIDTRALTRKLRLGGRQNGIIVSGDTECAAFRFADYQKRLETYRVRDASAVIPRAVRRYDPFSDGEEIYGLPSYSLNITVPDRSVGKGVRAALINFGACGGILKSLRFRGCSVTVYPAGTGAEEVFADNPDCVILSGGPGDPHECFEGVETFLRAIGSEGLMLPTLGIGLGHQLMALSAGFSTARLPFGHRGGNHPVRDEKTGRTYITSQNHGYVVTTESINDTLATVTHKQLNDGTAEGLAYKKWPAWSVQFHPEAGSGPQETSHVFDEFLSAVKEVKKQSTAKEA